MISPPTARRRFLPEGGSLPEEHWGTRHRAIVALLWAHVAFILVFALVRGFAAWHAILETLPVALFASAATTTLLSRRSRVLAASVGLLTTSAILVHLSGGVIEVHFHFFVMVAVVALYQDWVPFMAAIGYVLLHHGVVGVLDPTSVYNHAAAIQSPWKWAGIHSFFIAGISAVCLVTWRLNEQILDQRRKAEEGLREEREIVATLNEVGKTLAAELDLGSLIQKVTDAGTKLTAARFGAFFYNQHDGQEASFVLHSVSGARLEDFEGFPMPGDTGVSTPISERQEVVRIDDINQDPRREESGHYPLFSTGHLYVRSYLAVPVVSGRRLHGELFFGHPDVGGFTDHDEKLAAGVAAHAAVALENARLYESEIRTRESLEQAKQQLELMAEASKILFSSLELQTILKGLASVVAPALSDAAVAIVLEEGGPTELVGWHDDQGPPAAFSRDLVQEEVGAAGWWRSRSTQSFPSVTPESLRTLLCSPQLEERILALDPSSLTLVPLQRPNRHLGALILIATKESGRRQISPEHVHAAIEMAGRASIAIENAQLYSAQRGVAETLQHSLLLENLPAVPGIEAAARYLPGGPSVEVGGDWYDLFELSDGRVALAMGDVAGRGVPAASLMGQLRNALRAYSLHGGSPAEVLEKLNRTLVQLEAGEMATLFHAVLDLETGEITYANAGHPPPIVLGQEGMGSLDAASGIPLGTLRTSSYPETTLTLAPGAVVVAYTDGLVEDIDTRFEHGLTRLHEALSSADRSNLEDLCAETLTRLLEGRKRGDDVAILAFRLLPVSDRVTLKVPARPSSLRSLRAYLRRWLREAGVPDDELQDIILAAGEAFANAIVHSSVSATEFEVEAEKDGDIRITVTNEGPWTERSSSNVHGRGLLIIREIMDSYDVVREQNKTKVNMRRSFAGTSS